MAKSLVIVESPAKAKSIGKFLGRSYSVKASMGHVRDLPKSQFGVDIEHDFSPRYITVRGQGKTLAELRSAVKKAGKVYLATDPDREGEAISWHLAEALGLSAHTANRIEFHEITKQAVQKAIKTPRSIDTRRVDAQQARRVLDRVVGYKLSPLLWAKVKRGLSAGRVQSVALRLVTDREADIDAFVPEEYWSITATLSKVAGGAFAAKFIGRAGEKVELGDEAQTQSIVDQLQSARYHVSKVTRRERRRSPAAPFTTSTLQQEASRRLGFSARKTMSLAQQLYEGLDIEGHGTLGLITYLRTDSTRISPEAQTAAQQLIEQRWGRDYRPEKPPVYRTKSSAQDAHEAIRPTLVELGPDDVKKDLSRDQARLYRLIWERFIASQMAPAVMDTLTVDIDAMSAAGPPPWQLRATGSTLKFAGFMTLYIERKDDEDEETEGVLPDFAEGESLNLDGLEPKQHFTQPPPRFTEASLVKALEELGIGRPSTYVAIIDTLRKRGYATMEERRFVPTELGKIVVSLLKEHFPQVVDVEFTAGLEERLDSIEDGEADWVEVLRRFYEPFSQALEQAQDEIDAVQIEDEPTDELCEKCNRNMVIKWGRYGKFLACPGFPECKNTKPLLTDIGVACPSCGGRLVERRTRRGRVFYGCERYPECEFTSWKRPVNARCPRCSKLMVERRRRGGQEEWLCSDDTCGYSQPAAASEELTGSRI